MSNLKKAISVRWLAEEAGVSVATVSRALRQPATVAPKTREKILRLVEKHSYVPDGRAANLSSKRSGLVGLIIPTISNSIYAEFTEAIQNRLQEADLSLLIANTKYSLEVESGIIRKLIESRAEGVILTGYRRDAKLYQLLRHYDIPFVITWALSRDRSIPSISFDNQAAAADATEMLIKLGHRRIALICGISAVNDRAALRLKAYKLTLRKYGIALDDALVSEQPFEIDAAAEATSRFMSLAKPPTAIFCANDVQALGALFSCQRLKIRVPDDVSIMGFDDLPLVRLTSPRLSSVHVPARKMGGAVAEALIRQIKNDVPIKSEIIPTEMILRESTAPRRNSAAAPAGGSAGQAG